MSNKPDKFGIKFFLAVDVEHKYIFNGLPYCGKDENLIKDISLPTDVVLKLLEPVFNAGYYVTCHNYFTSLDLLRHLSEKKCSLLGTLRQNKREIPISK